jgi:hypothetical protein
VVGQASSWTAKVTRQDRANLGDLATPQLQCLFALQLGARGGVERQTAAEIARALEELGIAINATGVRNTLDSAATSSPRLVARSVSRPRSYRLTQPGERAIDAVLGGNVVMVRIEADKPLTARIRLAAVLHDLQGAVRVTDPYYGARTADALTAFAKASDVRLLTGTCGGGENEGAARRVLTEVTREFPKVQIRVAPTKELPHDRFVLTDDEMIIIGHGFKDIGYRESFVIRIPRSALPDTASQASIAFDGLWSRSTPLTK